MGFVLGRDHPALLRPGQGLAFDQEEVLVPVADGVVQQVPARAHPELDGFRIGEGGEQLRGHDAAGGAAPGVARVVVTEEETAGEGAGDVGADDQIGFRVVAVGEAEAGGGTGVVDVHHPLAQVQAVRVQRAEQDGLQVRAVDPRVGRAVAGAVVLAGGKPRDPFAGAAVAKDQAVHQGTFLGELSGQSEAPLVEACGVGGQCDGGADLTEDGGLFVDPDVQPLALQVDGKGQAADSAPMMAMRLDMRGSSRGD